MNNKTRFFIVLIIVLLISNSVLLFLVMTAPGGGNKPKEQIINELHFDDAQIKQYEVYIKEHRTAIREQNNIMNSLRKKLYLQLNENQNPRIIDSIIILIAEHQYSIEEINYNHFLEIKKLCKPSQIIYFETLSSNIADLFSVHKRK
jgi:protein CpxP